MGRGGDLNLPRVAFVAAASRPLRGCVQDKEGRRGHRVGANTSERDADVRVSVTLVMFGGVTRAGASVTTARPVISLVLFTLAKAWEPWSV